MRISQRPLWRALAGIIFASLMFVVMAPAQSAHADSYDNQVAQLRAQIAQLRSQLGSVGAQQQAAANAAAATQDQIAQTQAQLAATQQQLDDINAKIAQTTTQLGIVTDHLNHDKAQLSAAMASVYEMQSNGYSVDAVLNAKNFTDLTQTVVNLNKFNDSLQTLTTQVATEQKQLADLQHEQQAEQAQITAAMNQLMALQQQQQAQEAAYQQQAAALSGQAGSISAQIAADQGQVVSVQAAQAAAYSASQGGWVTKGNAIPPFGLGARFDAFPWGQCTWYVASLRDVTWSGDAWAWAANAAAHGASEGMTPKPGAIVVWGRGNGYSDFGHVAYVVSVTGPDSFVVDEGNYLGLGIIDQRAVPSLHDVETFIY